MPKKNILNQILNNIYNKANYSYEYTTTQPSQPRQPSWRRARLVWGATGQAGQGTAAPAAAATVVFCS